MYIVPLDLEGAELPLSRVAVQHLLTPRRRYTATAEQGLTLSSLNLPLSSSSTASRLVADEDLKWVKNKQTILLLLKKSHENFHSENEKLSNSSEMQKNALMHLE